MTEALVITAQDVRDYAGFPSDVSDTLLDTHLASASRKVASKIGQAEAPAGYDDTWKEAHIVCALSTCFSWLNTFALDGATKTDRLAEAITFRFLDAGDVDARVEKLEKQFEELIGELNTAIAAAQDDIDDASEDVTLGGMSMVAV